MRLIAILAAAALLHCGHEAAASTIPKAGPLVKLRNAPWVCWDQCYNAEEEYKATGKCGPAYRSYWEACKLCSEHHGENSDDHPWRCS